MTAPGGYDRRDTTSSKPAWLLALVVMTFVSALVFLEYAQRPVVNLMTLAVPILTALYVVSRVEKRSDVQDDRLAEHGSKLATIERATNGELTERLNEQTVRLTEQITPLAEQVALLNEALARNHPDDPAVNARHAGNG